MASAVPSAQIGTRTTPPWTKERAGFLVLFVVGAALLVLSWHGIGMGVLPLFTGVGNIVHFLAQTVPPQFVDFRYTAYLALVTLCMAILGTALAVVLSIPVALMAARNTTLHPAVRWVARAVIVVCRSIPDLIFAIIFVESIGIGVLPGVLALAFHSVGMLGKLYAEQIEQVPPGPPEAIKSTGATRWQAMMTGVVPQVMPSFSSIALYRLDINLRSSVILGYVGAGGIGFLLNTYMGELQFRAAIGIVLVMFVMIVAMEVTAAVIRRSLIGMEGIPVKGSGASRQSPAAGGFAIRSALLDRMVARVSPLRAGALQEKVAPGHVGAPAKAEVPNIRPPWTRARIQRWSFVAGALALVAASFIVTKTSPWQALTSLRQIWDTVVLYFPPDFTTARSSLLGGTMTSFEIAVVATCTGYVVAIPVGLLAARNVSGRWVARIARLVLLVIRAVPDLILAIVFVVAVGLGPVAGAMALFVGTVGFVAKLVADGLEEVSPMPREAVFSMGATKGQEVAASVVHASTPMLVGNAFYVLDINFRSAIILGIVGAGGLGFLLQQSVQVLAYRTTGAIIVCFFVVVLLIEVVTNWVRRNLI
jgi:phosphonate transport system permease protein